MAENFLYSTIAPAKLNLTLRVIDKCETGYHRLRSLVVPLSLGDDVQLRITRGTGKIEFSCTCWPELRRHVEHVAVVEPQAIQILAALSTSANLAYRALFEVVERFPEPFACYDYELKLLKRLPFGAGLGGGSSNAAAVLRLLAEFQPNFDYQKFCKLAGDLGSDVAVMLQPGLHLMWARGERCLRLSHEQSATALPDVGLVVLKPPVSSPTGLAYKALARDCALTSAELYADAPEGDGITQPMLANFGLSLEKSPQGKRILTSLSREGSSPKLIKRLGFQDLVFALENDFHEVIEKQIPMVAQAVRELEQAGARRVLLAGSGSAVVGFAPTLVEAEQVATKFLDRDDWFCAVTSFA